MRCRRDGITTIRSGSAMSVVIAKTGIRLEQHAFGGDGIECSRRATRQSRIRCRRRSGNARVCRDLAISASVCHRRARGGFGESRYDSDRTNGGEIVGDTSRRLRRWGKRSRCLNEIWIADAKPRAANQAKSKSHCSRLNVSAPSYQPATASRHRESTHGTLSGRPLAATRSTFPP